MTVVVVLAVLVGFVAYEVRADRRNRRFSAPSVVVVAPPQPRWWRSLAARVRETLLALLVLAVLFWLALSIHGSPGNAEHTWPMPSAEPASLAPAGTSQPSLWGRTR